MNWIPRNARWSQDERKAKETAARYEREINYLIWNEKNELRRQIESEINEIKQAKIKLLEF